MINPGRAIAVTAAGALVAVSALFSAVPAAAEQALPPAGASVDVAFCVLPDGAYRLDYASSGWPDLRENLMHFSLGGERVGPVLVNTSGSIVTTLTASDWDGARPSYQLDNYFGGGQISDAPPTEACPNSGESVVSDRGIGVDTGITGSASTAQPAPDLAAVAGPLLGAAGFATAVVLLRRRLSRDGLRRR